MARLLEKYKEEIVPQMISRFKYKNKLEVPRIKKIVVNMGVGEAAHEIKELDTAMEELAMITGQKPATRRAKKAIANFKIRQDSPVGCMVTLRRARMYEFLDRLVNIAIPRVRDFRGLSTTSFDKGANYSFGITEQIIFPEIEYDKVQKIRGMDVTIVTSAKTKEEAFELLKLFGMPFKKGSGETDGKNVSDS
ncbi:MAG: 50S ribosomal protein L5 [Candidatus Omnitrophica bacterium CG07_land_8_20_14_0_80_42_15]|uniref:Large ribosomal subunit protein uL5 n=1 Tax=Candidatus Aquitaenariimonas noxiae TaxID=1974741 RepID=A0A2J0KX95_9BACT|nr:MAG: 50S ribosomal protein L5 [Candidatus Omnitrophica bacterium CG07_land_8_20_14_0_80_42_15]